MSLTGDRKIASSIGRSIGLRVSLAAVSCGLAFLFLWSRAQSQSIPTALPLRVGFVKIADSAQLYVGLDNGYYAAQGLHIETQEFQMGSLVLEALSSRGSDKLDIGFSNLVAILQARARGMNLVTFAGGPTADANRPTNGLLVSPSSSIVRPKDLAGKTIALNALGANVENLMLRRYLRQVKVDPSSVTVVQIAFPQIAAALKARDVDAASLIEPYLSAALREKAGRLLAHHYADISKRMAIATYCATEEKIDTRREEFRRFIRGSDMATEYISTHPRETLQIVLKYTKLDATAAGALVPAFQARHGIADLQFWADMMQQENYLSQPLQVGALLPRI
jgi:NitT/TauT family transport system substrate-binding protein